MAPKLPDVRSSRFQLIRQLVVKGANNRGIYLAVDKGNDRQLAILKRLPPGNEAQNLREAKKMVRLAGHLNIVEMYEFLPVNGKKITGQQGDHSDISSDSDFEIVSGYTSDWEIVDERPRNEKTAPRDELYMAFCFARVGIQTVYTLGDVFNLYRGRFLPEAFLWDILEGMLKALCFLQFGVRNVLTDSPDTRWEPIFHRDIHPENIFLSDSTQRTNRYPRVILGDFGIALTPSEMRMQFEGTPPHQRPSDISNFEEWTEDMEWKTDVKDLGRVMYTLCHDHPMFQEYNNAEKGEQSDDIDDDVIEEEEKEEQRFGGDSWNARYSEALREVMRSMNGMTDLDARFLEYSRRVITTRAELLRSGKLLFECLHNDGL